MSAAKPAAEKDAHRRHLEALNAARLSVACQSCDAAAGEPCDMPGGKRADTIHEGRYRATLPLVNDLVDQYHGRVVPPGATEGRPVTSQRKASE